VTRPADEAVARSLERTEALGSAGYVDAKARSDPGSAAESRRLGGATCIFDGPDSPLTQTFGLGMTEPVTVEGLEAIEAFFRERGAPVFHEVSPLADDSARELLGERGYRPVEFTSVLYRELGDAKSLAGELEDRVAPSGEDPPIVAAPVEGPDGHETWARVAAEGWSEFGDLSDLMRDVARVDATRPDAPKFVATRAREAIAAGALFLGPGVAFLAGAATIPSARRRGAQNVLLAARLRYAADLGRELAMMGARPGSASQRNAERRGFRVAYTRVKWGMR